MSIPRLPDFSRIVLAVLLLITIGIVGATSGLWNASTASIQADTDTPETTRSSAGGDDAAPDKPVFLHGNCPIIGPLYWGIGSGNVETDDLPMQFKARAPPQVASAFAAGDGVAGITLLHQLPALTEQLNDINILPYTFQVPGNLTAVYADPDAGIDSPADLAGKRLAVPNTTDGFQVLAVLDEQYNVTVDDMAAVRFVQLSQARRLLMSGEVDAAYSPTWVESIDQNYTKIIHARDAFAEARGIHPIAWHAALVRDGYIEEADAMMQRLKRSAAYGADHPEQFSQGIYGTGALAGEYMLQTMRKGAIEPMSGDVKEALQELLNRGYQQGVYDARVNLSRMLVDSERLTSS